MACRRIVACEDARSALLLRHPNGSCECRRLDLADYNSIRKFCQGLKERNNNLTISSLVNNAGVMGIIPTNSEGADVHLRVNHFGTYLLTRLLLPHMAHNARIVTVGSEAHRRGSMKFQSANNSAALEIIRPDRWYASYARSKLGNVLMTAELSRRLEQRYSGVTTSCVSPGRVATDIFKNLHGVVGFGVRSLASMCFQTPEQGAQGVLLAASSAKFEGRSILYIHNSAEAEPSQAARDADLALTLWDFTNREVGLSQTDDLELWPRS